jgi:hypothetical protein
MRVGHENFVKLGVIFCFATTLFGRLPFNAFGENVRAAAVGIV